jgi:hypothetical protein
MDLRVVMIGFDGLPGCNDRFLVAHRAVMIGRSISRGL